MDSHLVYSILIVVIFVGFSLYTVMFLKGLVDEHREIKQLRNEGLRELKRMKEAERMNDVNGSRKR